MPATLLVGVGACYTVGGCWPATLLVNVYEGAGLGSGLDVGLSAGLGAG